MELTTFVKQHYICSGGFHAVAVQHFNRLLFRNFFGVTMNEDDNVELVFYACIFNLFDILVIFLHLYTNCYKNKYIKFIITKIIIALLITGLLVYSYYFYYYYYYYYY